MVAAAIANQAVVPRVACAGAHIVRRHHNLTSPAPGDAVLSQPYVDRILDDVVVGDNAPVGYNEAAAAALALPFVLSLTLLLGPAQRSEVEITAPRLLRCSRRASPVVPRRRRDA